MTAAPLDSVLSFRGIEATPQWLGNPDIVDISLASTSVWRYMGLNFVLFLGAIQSIDRGIYEAAEIDGAPSGRFFPRVRSS